MKVIKAFSIDMGLIDVLEQEENASLLVNTLLNEYFKSNLRFKEIENISDLIEKKREINKKMREIRAKNSEKSQKIAENHRKIAINSEKLRGFWQVNKITDADYWDCFDKNGKFDIEKAEKLFNERGLL